MRLNPFFSGYGQETVDTGQLSVVDTFAQTAVLELFTGAAGAWVVAADFLLFMDKGSVWLGEQRSGTVILIRGKREIRKIGKSGTHGFMFLRNSEEFPVEGSGIGSGLFIKFPFELFLHFLRIIRLKLIKELPVTIIDEGIILPDDVHLRKNAVSFTQHAQLNIQLGELPQFGVIRLLIGVTADGCHEVGPVFTQIPGIIPQYIIGFRSGSPSLHFRRSVIW